MKWVLTFILSALSFCAFAKVEVIDAQGRVLSLTEGHITHIEDEPDRGKRDRTVYIQDRDGMTVTYTLYDGHFFGLKVGDKIAKGQAIGISVQPLEVWVGAYFDSCRLQLARTLARWRYPAPP